MDGKNRSNEEKENVNGLPYPPVPKPHLLCLLLLLLAVVLHLIPRSALMKVFSI